MNVLIISIDHVVQRARRVLELPGTAAKKNRLEALIRQEIAARNVQFISEEADPRTQAVSRDCVGPQIMPFALSSAGGGIHAKKNWNEKTKSTQDQAAGSP
jgi:hypothetical protein